VVNRGALILRYKEPAVRWINEADPAPSPRPISLEDVNEERTVYLIDDAVGDDDRSFERWLKRSYGALFEMELEGWYTDEGLWPQDRTYSMFRQWFDPELHTVLIDLGDGIILDDEA
jgi:hypothetical protein